MNAIFRYIGYCVVSALFGWLSSVGDKDILNAISNNLFQLLITIIVLYITLSNLIYNQITLIQSKYGNDTSSGISALKRNIRIMFAIIALDFTFFGSFAGGSHSVLSIVSHLPHDWGDSRITHAYVPKTAVFCRVGQKEKRWKSSDFSVLRWKFGLPCDPPGSSDLKYGEIRMKWRNNRNLLI